VRCSTATVTVKVSPGFRAMRDGHRVSEGPRWAWTVIGSAGMNASVGRSTAITEDSTRLFKFIRYPLMGTRTPQYKSCRREGRFLYPENPPVIRSLPRLHILPEYTRIWSQITMRRKASSPDASYRSSPRRRLL